MGNYRFLIIGFILSIGLWACQKAADTPAPDSGSKPGAAALTFFPSQGHGNLIVKISGTGFGDKRENVVVEFNKVAAVVKEVTDKSITAVVPVNATTGKVAVTVNGLTLTSANDFIIVPKNLSLLTGSWEQKADFPGNKRNGVAAFSNATSGFLAGGALSGFTYKDIWQYQAASNEWVQRADFPGLPRMGAVNFTIGKKVYIVTGYANFSPGKINDLWEFDTETYVWTKKADFPGPARQYATGFTLNGRGYVVTGFIDYFEPELKDMWEYDPVTNKWQRKADIPFASRHGAAGFSIGDKGYVGFGTHVAGSVEERLNDFWQYDSSTDRWTRKEDFPEYINFVNTSFVLNQNAYVIIRNQEFWHYNPGSDKWSQKTSLPVETAGATSFVVGNNAYVVDPFNGKLYQYKP